MSSAGSDIRILIVDDHPVVRAGLTSMLATQPGLEVADSVSSGEEALDMLECQRLDVVLLDLRMPGMNGIDTLLAIKRKAIPVHVIVLTSYETDEDIYRAGNRYIPRRIASRLAERMTRSNLTARELEILKILTKGLTNKQIASALGISDNTVRNHINSIIEKLEVSDRTEASTTAIQRGIVDVDE